MTPTLRYTAAMSLRRRRTEKNPTTSDYSEGLSGYKEIYRRSNAQSRENANSLGLFRYKIPHTPYRIVHIPILKADPAIPNILYYR